MGTAREIYMWPIRPMESSIRTLRSNLQMKSKEFILFLFFVFFEREDQEMLASKSNKNQKKNASTSRGGKDLRCTTPSSKETNDPGYKEHS